MPSERFMRHHYGASGLKKNVNTQDCGRLGHLFGAEGKCLFCEVRKDPPMENDTEKIARLEAQLAQVRAQQGWRSIETALKDGSRVELWGPDGIDVGEWHDGMPDLIESGVLVDPGSDAGWYGACGYWPGGNQPTHWRPIVGPMEGEALATGTPPAPKDDSK